MLLPSALSCDVSHVPTRNPAHALFSYPSLSTVTTSSDPDFSNIYNTCYALQLILSPMTTPSQMSSPSKQVYSSPKFRHLSNTCKVEDRSRENLLKTRQKITKRAPSSRGPRKRKTGTEKQARIDAETENINHAEVTHKNRIEHGPQTPTRIHSVPEVLPLGLERSDFLNLGRQDILRSKNISSKFLDDFCEDGDEWSIEDDRLLVNLVLQKLKLSKNDWYECARSLGRERNSLGKRWKSLLIQGQVGYKDKRNKIGGTFY